MLKVVSGAITVNVKRPLLKVLSENSSTVTVEVVEEALFVAPRPPPPPGSPLPPPPPLLPLPPSGFIVATWCVSLVGVTLQSRRSLPTRNSIALETTTTTAWVAASLLSRREHFWRLG